MQRIYKVILLFLVFCMMQKPEFFFIPSSNNTFFGMVGFMFFLFSPNDRRRILSNISIGTTPWVRAIMPFVIVAVTAIVVNMSFDLKYIKYIITLFFAFWASYLITVVAYRAYGKFELGIFIKYLLTAEIIYIFISVLMFFNSSFSDAALSLLKMDAIMEVAVERTSGLRILGFGATFFSSGILNGFVLILLAVYMSQNKFSTFKSTLLYTLYILITVVGMMMARTALVGSAIGLVIIGMNLIKDPKAMIKTILLIVLVIAVLIFALMRLSAEFAAQLETLFEFAFEMFFNLAESGSMSTSSTDTLMTMYDAIPTTFKSWIIGDAKWDTATGYYKGTDVGYLRNIWYFGVVGMGALIYFYYKTLKIIFIERNTGFEKPWLIMLTLFAYVIVLNFKGPADLFFYVIPLYFITPSTSSEESSVEQEDIGEVTESVEENQSI